MLERCINCKNLNDDKFHGLDPDDYKYDIPKKSCSIISNFVRDSDEGYLMDRIYNLIDDPENFGCTKFKQKDE